MCYSDSYHQAVNLPKDHLEYLKMVLWIRAEVLSDTNEEDEPPAATPVNELAAAAPSLVIRVGLLRIACPLRWLDEARRRR